MRFISEQIAYRCPRCATDSRAELVQETDRGRPPRPSGRWRQIPADGVWEKVTVGDTTFWMCHQCAGDLKADMAATASRLATEYNLPS